MLYSWPPLVADIHLYVLPQIQLTYLTSPEVKVLKVREESRDAEVTEFFFCLYLSFLPVDARGANSCRDF